jgi:peptide/nickel transport system permease protein
MLVIVVVISVVAFIIIQLPPGDYVTTLIIQLKMGGQQVDQARIASLTKRYGLDLPIYTRYFFWMWKILHGDFGISFQWNQPVKKLMLERLPLTLALAFFAITFTYIVAIPVGIYSAVRQYSIGDYIFTVIGFAGLAIPNFLLALISMFLFYKYFGFTPGGLFSFEFAGEALSLSKFIALLRALIIPIIIIGTSGTCSLIRVIRGCLLDELKKQYVITARAKGLSERTLLFKYPVKVAMNPIISTIGWMLPWTISGQTITSIVLGLPTMGPLLFQALMSQDMYLAGSIVIFLAFLVVAGTLISDILLMWVDPRIRFEKSAGS